MADEFFHDLKIEAILEEELYTNPPLMPVAVAKLIGDKQDIPRVFRLTKDIASTAELKHLRRIRDAADGGIECIICSLPTIRENDTKIGLINDLDSLVKVHEERLRKLEERFAPENILEDFRIVLVPNEAPRTKHQQEACKKLWPCKYAKSNYLINCIEGSVFSEAERLVVKIITDKLLQHINSSNCSKTSGAVIFRYAQVYGVGLSCCETLAANPTQHSPMLAIDSVAQNAGSSCWKCHGEEEEGLQVSIQQGLNSQPLLIGHKIEADFLPYLCTNYDVILTEQPCMMCAMGLVQSRIRRLFYLDPSCYTRPPPIDASNFKPVCYPDGAIENFLVHRDKSLNHRFEAWRIKLNSE